MNELTPFEEGLLVGVLLGEGSFGGDGKQPQIALKMHVRREALVRWLADHVPGSRLYGPYSHGDREYFQWMVRGRALVEGLLPLLERSLRPELDAHAAARLAQMCERYAGYIERVRARG